MDIELARTFLAIARSGSFGTAAAHLHVTQTTVTARVQRLEDALGCQLFVRGPQGARLSDDGHGFVPYATRLVEAWDAARRALPMAADPRERLAVGAEQSVWNPLLTSWIGALRASLPALALHAEVGASDALHRRLESGAIDLALVHLPEYRQDFQIEQLCEEKLVMVRTRHAEGPYVFVDWGEAFRRQHDAALPEHARRAFSVNLGPLALNHLLAHGGSGYFRTRVIRRHVAEGLLDLVDGAPEFPYPLFVVHARRRPPADLEPALALLRAAALRETDWSQHGLVPGGA